MKRQISDPAVAGGEVAFGHAFDGDRLGWTIRGRDLEGHRELPPASRADRDHVVRQMGASVAAEGKPQLGRCGAVSGKGPAGKRICAWREDHELRCKLARVVRTKPGAEGAHDVGVEFPTEAGQNANGQVTLDSKSK